MENYSIDVIQRMMKFTGSNRDARGTVTLFVPAFRTAVEFHVELVYQDTIQSKSVETINDIVNMSEPAFSKLLQLLHADAMRAKEEVGFGDPDAVQEQAPGGFLARMFKRERGPEMVMLAPNDPRHPCFFEDGLASVESKVAWLGFCIDEHIATQTRMCVLDCRPRWEDEHGVTIVFRDGIPLSVGADDLAIEEFDLV